MIRGQRSCGSQLKMHTTFTKDIKTNLTEVLCVRPHPLKGVADQALPTSGQAV